MNGKTVLIIGSYAPSLVHFRGALIAAIAGHGHKVLAAAPSISDKVADQLRSLGAEPLDVELVNASLDPFAMMKSLRELRRLIGHVRPDTIIAYTVNLPISP